jgi:methoxymalonate biosynthesis acyl carrier protein
MTGPMAQATAGQTVTGRPADAVRTNLLDFLEQRTKRRVAVDTDLFATGLVSSLFALELVVHVENAFGVAVTGCELTLDNFRTVDAIAALVLRLSGAGDA